jgi:hypothetical protein
MGASSPGFAHGYAGGSDILLLRRAEDLPETLVEAAHRMLPRTHLPAGEPITLAWEVYGLDGLAESLDFRMKLEEEEGGLVRRALNRIGIFRKDPTLSLAWSERGSGEVGPLFRVIDVDLPPLEPGRYVIHLEMDTSRRSKVLSCRRITVF